MKVRWFLATNQNVARSSRAGRTISYEIKSTFLEGAEGGARPDRPTQTTATVVVFLVSPQRSGLRAKSSKPPGGLR